MAPIKVNFNKRAQVPFQNNSTLIQANPNRKRVWIVLSVMLIICIAIGIYYLTLKFEKIQTQAPPIPKEEVVTAKKSCDLQNCLASTIHEMNYDGYTPSQDMQMINGISYKIELRGLGEFDDLVSADVYVNDKSVGHLREEYIAYDAYNQPIYQLSQGECAAIDDTTQFMILEANYDLSAMGGTINYCLIS